MFVVGASLIFFLLCGFIFIRERLKPVDKKWRLRGRRWKLPGGPRGVPILGNMLQFFEARDTGRLTLYLQSLRSYGEMTTLHMGSHTWVLLNTGCVASEIIAKRAKVTNERPYMPVAGGLVSNNKRAVIRRAAEWAEGRRVMHHLLSGSALKLYGEWQELESVQLLLSYLSEPKNWYAHHFRYSTAIFYRIVMGERLFKSQEQLDNYQKVTMEFLFSLFRSPIDFFPTMDNLPISFQFWRKPWEGMGRFHRRIFQEWWTPIRAAVIDGTAGASFVRDVLLHPDVRFVGDDEEAMYLATSVMAAGGDNTRMTLNTFVMSSLCYPAVYCRARVEIESVVEIGDTIRLPNMEDMASMPYLCAVIKEILRWRPTVPLIPPHQLTEELEYGKYIFPPGTNFLINTVAICSECEAADEFRPERWLDGNEGNIIHNFWGFGGGRRICVGYKVVQQALFVAIARLIYCYDITPNGQYDSTKLNHWSLTEPFPVKVSVRSPRHESLVLAEASKCKLT